MIDWARVEELRNDMGEEGFDEVVELFLEEMDDRISAMKSGSEASRAEDLHFLKGCSANVGFSSLRDLCTNAEQDDSVSMTAVWACYDKSKVEFLAGVSVVAT